MNDKVLLAALLKLHDKHELPASQFPASQRSALDRFSRQTGALISQRQGRGTAYRVVNPDLFHTHLAALSPGLGDAGERLAPLRARHIADARDSKARSHRHEHHYLLLKSVGEGVLWRESSRGIELPLDQATRNFGAATLAIDTRDAWFTATDLWLVENQAVFDRTDWLPASAAATVAYYAGQLNGLLLNWLASRQRASQVIHFPDYDGVGLANFTRLHAALGDACQFWLMPDWSEKLDHYGSAQLWRATLHHFTSASPKLPAYVIPLAERMRQSGLALEQEAVWLP